MSVRFAERLRAAMRSPRSGLWAALALSVVLFHVALGLHLLSAKAAVWSFPYNDMTQMVAGELAGLREPWGLPLLVTRTLIAPQPVSLVYTDSIPWLTAALKLLHLGPVLSLLGTALLLAWLSQAGAAYLLLRALGVERRWTLFVGASLALLFPAFLGRQVGHIALSFHALQIAALALAVHAARRGFDWRVLAGFTGLSVLGAGVHAYHVPVITGLLFAALASDSLQRRAGWGSRVAVALTIYLATVAAAAWVLGYAVGRGASGGTAVLGYFAMNMAAPLWPQGSALAGQRWNGGWFTRTLDPTGGQSFEGFNYLGAGVLLLLCAGLVLAMMSRGSDARAGSDARPPRMRRWGPLLAVLALFTVYAVGPKAWLGSWRLWDLSLPDARWAEPLALFRAHGRFFWTVGYALLAGAVVAVDRLPRATLRNALLGVALGVQAADASELLRGLHERFSRPDRMYVPATLAGRAFSERSYRVYPDYFCTRSEVNHAAIRQLSLIAQRQHSDINTAATARPPPGACESQIPAEALADAVPGDRRITVVLGDDGAPNAMTTRFRWRTDCYAFEQTWFCGRDLAEAAPLRKVEGADLIAPTQIDADLDIGDPAFLATLGPGWDNPEPHGVWAISSRAVLRLPRPIVREGKNLVVRLDALALTGPRLPFQRVWASVGGVRVAELRVDRDYRGQVVKVPARLLRGAGPLLLALDLPDAVSPNVITPGAGDDRILGIGLRGIHMSH